VHIKENAKVKNIWLDSIDGHSEHMHCLISLNKDISIKDTMQLIKGESSHWINALKLIKEKFNWQDDYWMVGVSESHITQVRNYIENQNIHHAKKSFKQEINEFMKKYGWEIIKD
jgi:putative transposase